MDFTKYPNLLGVTQEDRARALQIFLNKDNANLNMLSQDPDNG